jgi:hypothetical protein
MSAKANETRSKRKKKAYKPLTKQQSRDLVRAVRDWLSFQRLCGRDMIFSERSLSQPIAEYSLATHKGRIVPEFNHPGFATEGAGRPKQMGFALLRSRGDNAQAVIETKWIGETSYSKQAIVDDILRLECFRNKSDAHASRYFLVAGLTTTFCSNFQDLQYNEDGQRWQFTASLLEFKNTTSSTVEVLNADPGLRKVFRLLPQPL